MAPKFPVSVNPPVYANNPPRGQWVQTFAMAHSSQLKRTVAIDARTIQAAAPIVPHEQKTLVWGTRGYLGHPLPLERRKSRL